MLNDSFDEFVDEDDALLSDIEDTNSDQTLYEADSDYEAVNQNYSLLSLNFHRIVLTLHNIVHIPQKCFSTKNIRFVFLSGQKAGNFQLSILTSIAPSIKIQYFDAHVVAQ